jgi:glycosyltransferase involved in cell wall biosynthesis
MDRKIKILHVIKSLGRGGAEMLLPETLRLHDQNRYEFHYIYFLPWKNQMVSAIQECGGTVTCLPASNNVQLILKAGKVADYVRTHQIDLVHAHLPWAGIVARIVGKMTGVPVIYTEHNKQERYHTLTRLMNLATMNWLTRTIAVSGDVEASILKHKANLRVKLQTVLNGVNMQRFAPGYPGAAEVKKSLGIPARAHVIGTIAVFRFQKRLDVWMDLAAEILKQKPETHFIIVGDGPQKEMLTAKRKALNLEHRIHFAGLQEEVRPYLSAFDLYMMCSVFEGLPIALLEAMSSGCAIVSTNAGGIREVVRNEIDGLICDVDDYNQLPDMASRLLGDDVLRGRLAANARDRVAEGFSMAKMVKDLESIYLEITAGRRAKK